MADQAPLLELGERGPAFFDISVGDWPVDLVQIDRVDPQSRDARLGLAQDRVAFEAVNDAPVGSLQ